MVGETISGNVDLSSGCSALIVSHDCGNHSGIGERGRSSVSPPSARCALPPKARFAILNAPLTAPPRFIVPLLLGSFGTQPSGVLIPPLLPPPVPPPLSPPPLPLPPPPLLPPPPPEAGTGGNGPLAR